MFVCLGAVAGVVTSASGKGVGQLNSQLGQAQAQTQSLSTSVSSLNSEVASLGSRISLVQQREAAADQTLSADDAALQQTKTELAHERLVYKQLQARLKLAQRILDRQLVSQYEQPQQTLVSLVLDSHGFGQLLSQLQYLKSAQKQEQAIISFTRKAKTAAIAAERRVAGLENEDLTAAEHAQTQAAALTGMQSLLSGQEAALADARNAKAAALAAAQEHGAALEAEIQKIQAEQQAANNASNPGAGGSGAYDGWAIPEAIVLCESGGQNLPSTPGHSASGYYQIEPATWTGYGGTGPQAYLASKAEQGVVAAKIWDGGAGASNWTCAALVGYK